MLLSKNDLEFIRKAMDEHRDIIMERTLGTKKVEVIVSHIPEKSKVWNCDMIITLCVTDGHVTSTQNFKSVNDMLGIRRKDI